MPNVLVRPEHMCKGTKHDGTPCHSPRRSGQPFCVTHSPGRAPPAPSRNPAVVPSESLDALVHLDPADPLHLQRMRIGFVQHVAAGTIEHQAASAIMRFAEAAHAHAPRRRDDDDALSPAARALLGGTPGKSPSE